MSIFLEEYMKVISDEHFLKLNLLEKFEDIHQGIISVQCLKCKKRYKAKTFSELIWRMFPRYSDCIGDLFSLVRLIWEIYKMCQNTSNLSFCLFLTHRPSWHIPRPLLQFKRPTKSQSEHLNPSHKQIIKSNFPRG